MAAKFDKDSPMRDQGLIVGAVIIALGLFALVRNIAGGVPVVLPLFMLMVGLSVPVLFWSREQRASGWRKTYRVVQLAVGGLILLAGIGLIVLGPKAP